jgi:hypothetical protein
MQENATELDIGEPGLGENISYGFATSYLVNTTTVDGYIKFKDRFDAKSTFKYGTLAVLNIMINSTLIRFGLRFTQFWNTYLVPRCFLL